MGLIALRETNNGLSRKIAILTERCEKVDWFTTSCHSHIYWDYLFSFKSCLLFIDKLNQHCFIHLFIFY